MNGVGATTPAAPAPRTADQAAAPAIASTAKSLAATPPVDTERVARIRKAIAEGRFPIYPATIADRMLAFKLDWKPNDPA